MEIGALYRFEGGYCPMKFYGKIAVYLGEDFIHRDDGITIENHNLLLQGETAPRCVDRMVLRWLTPLKKSLNKT